MTTHDRDEKLKVVADLAEELGLDDVAEMLRSGEVPELTASEMDGTAHNGAACRLKAGREWYRKFWAKWPDPQVVEPDGHANDADEALNSMSRW